MANKKTSTAKVVETKKNEKVVVKKTVAKSTKKAAVKKSPVKQVSMPVETPKKTSMTKKSSLSEKIVMNLPKNKKISKSGLIVLAIIVILAVLYFFRSSFIVAFVNGQPVSRAEFNHNMEISAGKQALNDVITQKLIMQEAAKRHISVSDKDVNDQLKSIQTMLSKQGLKLDQALAAKGMTMNDLTNQIKLQKMLTIMLGNKAMVSDKEVQDYIDKNQDSFKDPTTGEVNVTSDIKNSIKQQLATTKVSQLSQNLVDDLTKKAKINYFVQF